MSQRDYVAWMRKELGRSKRFRQDHDDDWKRYIDLYKGKHWSASSDNDQLVVNLIFATVNVMVPAVAIHNPRFAVEARLPTNADNAMIAEEVLNYLWRTHHYQREFKLAIEDWIVCGTGWCKVGYKATKEPEERKVDTPGVSKSDNTDEGESGDDYGIDDREDMEGNVESELHVDPDNDRPFVERISLFDMYIDPDARHIKEARWVAQRTWRALADVKVDSRYVSTQRSKVGSTSWSKWDGGGEDQNQDGRSDDDLPDHKRTGYVEVMEFYDIKRNQVSTFAYNADRQGGSDSGFLIKPTKMPYAFGHPFVMLRNYEIPDTLYPMGDVQQIESLQLELNETRTQMLNYRKKFRRAWVYAKDRFDRDGIAALESDDDNVMIPVQGDSNPSDSVAPMPAIVTPAEWWDQSAMISDDLDRVSGISDYQRGGNENIKRTATEAAMIQDASNARAQDRLSKVELILSEIGERVMLLQQQYMTGEQMARIVTMPIKGWFPYTADHIRGRFDFTVQGGSTEPQNETFRRQSALQIVDASIPFMDAGVVNMPTLYAELLRRGFGIKDAERYVNMPAPPPELAGLGQGGSPVPPSGEPPPGPPMEQPMPPEMGGGMPPQGMPPGGGMPPEMMGAPPQGMPPELMAMMGGGMPPGMPPGPQGGGPAMSELTPEILAALKMMAAQESGLPIG